MLLVRDSMLPAPGHDVQSADCSAKTEVIDCGSCLGILLVEAADMEPCTPEKLNPVGAAAAADGSLLQSRDLLDWEFGVPGVIIIDTKW